MSDDAQQNKQTPPESGGAKPASGEGLSLDAPEKNADAAPAPKDAAPQADDSMGQQIPEDIFSKDDEDTAPQAPDQTKQTAEPAAAAAPEKPAQKPPSKPPGAAQSPAGTSAAKDGKKKFSFKSGGLGSKAEAPKQAAGKPASTPKSDSAKNNVPRGALNAVVTRNEYYRDGYRNLMKIAFIEGLIIVGLVVAFIVYMNVHQERNRYFATTADGRILQLAPLDQPNISTPALMSWVSQAATEVMTFGFHDYQRRLQEASRHFTRRGWESFTTALQRSRIIESVETLQQVVTAAPRSAPVLLQEGIFNGRYRWVVRLPLTVTFKSGSKTTSSNLEVTITIERVPTLESPNGVGIESWIAV